MSLQPETCWNRIIDASFIYRMKIKKLPNVLALHLKRFKLQEDLEKYIKLTYRVAFPFDLRLFNTVDEMDDVDRLYNLFAIVVHIGKFVGPLSLSCCPWLILLLIADLIMVIISL